MDQITITYDEFEDKYQPVINEEDNALWRIEPDELFMFSIHFPIFYKMIKRHIWTEYDDHSVSSGIHFVNRFAYLFTHVPFEKDQEVFVNSFYDDESMESMK